MVLACQNISKAYGVTEILNHINFHIEAKEKLAIVGINGAGKSTLLKIIMTGCHRQRHYRRLSGPTPEFLL